MDDKEKDKKRLFISLLFPLCFVALLWIIKTIEVVTTSNFSNFGLYPLHGKGLIGIVTGPLIHGDWKHLINNSFPILILGWGVFYFYRDIAYKVFFLIYFLSQIWLWFFYVRPAWHIGASGLVYGFGAFLFVSGIVRKNRHLLAISLLVAFLYGSMVWGLLPIEEHISWEGHLMGLMAGIILAFYYKDFGPPLPHSVFDEEEEEDDDDLYYLDDAYKEEQST
jgi:membrane associated rhomboid family serine protease